MRDSIQLFINGERVSIQGEDAFLMLADFLRDRLRLVGTKICCAEGDCGACTVMLGSPEEHAGRWQLRYRPVNSCILPVAKADGCHVVTIEGLRTGKTLDAIQEAFVEAHGTQCGFCTPGMIMALTGVLEAEGPISDQDILDGLTGNLCRCTGYDGILKAARLVNRARHVRLRDRWLELRLADEAARAFFAPYEIRWDGRRMIKPAGMPEALALKAGTSDLRILSGCTDLGVAHNKHRVRIENGLSLSAIRELAEVKCDASQLLVGGNASIAEFERVLVQQFPELREYLRNFASPQIKNVGTVAGNLVNASPVGDLIPLLLALDARLHLQSHEGGHRLVDLCHFYKGYKTMDLRADEIVARIEVPLPPGGDIVRAYKVSRRKSLDISAVSAAFRIRTKGGKIAQARVAYGGVGPTALRLTEVEGFLQKKPLTQKTFDDASRFAAELVNPIDDVRGSAEYRDILVRNLLRKFSLEALAEGGKS